MRDLNAGRRSAAAASSSAQNVDNCPPLPHCRHTHSAVELSTNLREILVLVPSRRFKQEKSPITMFEKFKILDTLVTQTINVSHPARE